MTTNTLTKIIIPNSPIDITHTSSEVYIKIPITAGLESWSDLTGILTKLFGDRLTKKIVVRVLNQMGTVISMENKVASSTRISIEGHGNAHIDVCANRTFVSINAYGFQVKPMT